MSKLLLHICCAPCLIYPLGSLRQKGFTVTGLFYNPNIHPFGEYMLRKEAFSLLGAQVEMIYPEYSPREFFHAVNLKEDPPGRCALCWELRLKASAEAARENGCRYFTTTLLASPYQDQGLIKEIGLRVAQEERIEFYYEDFRPGFRKAHDEARAKGIYCQKYCGCIYSEIERNKKK